MPSHLDAPGLKRLKRHNGRVDCYWVADEAIVKRGTRQRRSHSRGATQITRPTSCTWPSAAAYCRPKCASGQTAMLPLAQ